MKQILAHLSKAAFTLMFIVLAVAYTFYASAEAAWLARGLDAWIAGNQWPAFSTGLTAIMIRESDPGLVQAVHFFESLSIFSLVVGCPAIIYGTDYSTKAKIVVGLAFLATPVIMPIIAILWALTILSLVAVFIGVISLALFGGVVESLCRYQMVMTTVSGCVGVVAGFVYLWPFIEPKSIAYLTLWFCASGMIGATFEELWRSPWGKKDLSDAWYDTKRYFKRRHSRLAR